MVQQFKAHKIKDLVSSMMTSGCTAVQLQIRGGPQVEIVGVWLYCVHSACAKPQCHFCLQLFLMRALIH